ncbi:FCD domain-containing protein [Alsobacter sp. KACC 23698]|uniref:FCD domain-containing protein n=1 Tax=Alsobacter sp. KACC 23698 TaxID=3149229 RepID=A0AAU7JMM7_9HYPH
MSTAASAVDAADHEDALDLEILDAPDAEAPNAVLQVRAFLARAGTLDHGRLPPERELAQALGVTRAELRKALAKLEAEGQLWRHVGKGTFVGSRPIDNLADVAGMARRTNPAEVMRARLAIEPEIARLAALNATPAHLSELEAIMRKSRQAQTWRQYESCDNRFHRMIAAATQNSLLLGLLDTLSAVRQAVNWGRLRASPTRPREDHHSFVEHEAIVAAIADRDMSRAAQAMRTHLQSVERNLLGRAEAED